MDNDKVNRSGLSSFQEIEQNLNASSHTSPIQAQLSPERFMVDESLIDRDYSYMKKISPSIVSQISDWIEEECDRIEYDGSFLYDQYPDKTTLLKMTERIAKNLPKEISISPLELIQALLCDEILYRRCRYYRKMKQFQ
ncbi:MAG: hypothetical protein Q4B70_16060 [Lachnospiraceae bacterium]|nr:hypothetical protein [Lachnospiraceae bacterium]